jgi:hypothetical protein
MDILTACEVLEVEKEGGELFFLLKNIIVHTEES